MKISKPILFVLAACALQACGLSSGLSEAEITALPVTAAMPTTGTATYAGTVTHTETDAGDSMTTNMDMSLGADFAAHTMSATLSNFRATGVEDGVTFSATTSGQLTGSGTITGSNFTVATSGNLTVGGETELVSLGVAGTFKGVDASAVAGNLNDTGVLLPFALNKR